MFEARLDFFSEKNKGHVVDINSQAVIFIFTAHRCRLVYILKEDLPLSIGLFEASQCILVEVLQCPIKEKICRCYNASKRLDHQCPFLSDRKASPVALHLANACQTSLIHDNEKL